VERGAIDGEGHFLVESMYAREEKTGISLRLIRVGKDKNLHLSVSQLRNWREQRGEIDLERFVKRYLRW
jgi:hypothetical protein